MAVSPPARALARPDRSTRPFSRRFIWILLLAGTVAGLMGIAAGRWDTAYHQRYLVDTFFSPPHLLLYGSMAGMLLIGLVVLAALLPLMWAEGGIRALLRYPLLVLPVAANLGFLATGPFDNWWHRVFGRDQATPWTVPHSLLLLDLVATGLAMSGLALWLLSSRPASGLDRPLAHERRAATLLLGISLSTVISYFWAFVVEWERGSTFGNPLFHLGAVYPPTAALIAGFVLTLSARLLPGYDERRWLLPLVVLAGQLWRLVPDLVLRATGYEPSATASITLLLVALAYARLDGVGRRWPVALRWVGFGLSFAVAMLIARALGQLSTLTLADLLLTVPLLPLAAGVGGALGDGLARTLRRWAGDMDAAQSRR